MTEGYPLPQSFRERDKSVSKGDSSNFNISVSAESLNHLYMCKAIEEKTNLRDFSYTCHLYIDKKDDYIAYLKDFFAYEETKGHLGELLLCHAVRRDGSDGVVSLYMATKHTKVFNLGWDADGRLDIAIGCDTQKRLDWCIENLDVYLNTKTKARWYFLDDDGSLIDTLCVLKSAKPCTELHVPWVEEEVDSFLDAFEESDSPIMILIGPPGTGKTSLINHYIQKYGKHAAVTYDQGVMRKDSFYIQYIMDYKQNLLILEDADDIIRKTEEGRSQVLSKILNVGDGIIDTSRKKIIITANIDDVENIDPAVSRKGRCFQVLTSRYHTPKEAAKLAEAVGIDAEFDDHISLAELFNGRNPQLRVEKQAFGFGII